MIVERLAEGKDLCDKSTTGRGVYQGRSGTEQELHDWWIAFQKQAIKQKIPLRVVWGYRTLAEQAELHQKGFGAPAGQSAHNGGWALDVIHMRRAWEEMPNEGWHLLGAIGKDVARKQGIDLVWGGDFKSRWDPAHWELADWRKRKAATNTTKVGKSLSERAKAKKPRAKETVRQLREAQERLKEAIADLEAVKDRLRNKTDVGR